MANIEEMISLLRQLFGSENVVPEWDVAKNSRDAYSRELYSPRVDVAVGPFNIDANIDYNNNRIQETYEKYKRFFQLIRSNSDRPNTDLVPNQNPRCFLVIEVESKNSRKHRLGSMVNASALGKIGVIVALNEKVFNSLVKIRKYLEYLERVQKPGRAPANILVITMEDFLARLHELMQ